MRQMMMLCAVLMVGAMMTGCGESEPTTRADQDTASEAETERSDASRDGEGTPEAEDAPQDEPGAAEAEASEPEVTELPVVELADIEALVTESAEQDRVMVVDFWATWCMPCVAMFPELHAGLKEMGDAVRPVSITLDDPGEWEQKAIDFLQKHDALKDAYRVKADSDAQLGIVNGLGERWNHLVVPAILVFDAQGELVGEFVEDGAETDRILARVREVVEEQ